MLAERKSYRAVSRAYGHTDCKQRSGRFKRTGRASRTGRCADTRKIKRKQNGFAFDIAEAEVCIVGQTLGSVLCAVVVDIVDLVEYTLYEVVSERCDIFVVFLNRLKCLVKCGCHADYAGCVGRAAAVRSFLLAAGEKFLDANAVSHVQHAHTLGAVKLVCGHGKQVNAQILDVILDCARCLNCVRME